MPRFSANVSIMFTDLPFLERFAAARAAGFEAAECWFPYEHSVETMRATIDRAGIVLNGINTAPGSEPGDWGLAGIPGREASFREGVEQALHYATRLGVTGIHVMAGAVGPAGREAHLDTYRKNLAWAADQAAGTDVTLVIEPLNVRDRPTYLVQYSDLCARIVDEVAKPKLKLLFDVYHIQISEGDLITRLRRHFSKIGHIQIAAVPSRAEPDEGEVNYRDILREIDALGWTGWVGCEYKPRGDVVEGLRWREALAGGR
jgi:hydroxypyruvate isomerase